jgi:RNA polymerase sigma-70 factor, ECF subfamily
MESDLILVKKAKAGDETAFRNLINRHRDRLVNFCIRYLDSRSEGEDIAQEICVVLYEKLGTFNEKSQFSTWLYRIAVNRCKNRYGSWWNRLTRQGKRVSSVDRETSEITIIDSTETTDRSSEKSELSEFLMSTIATLQPQFREVILLRDLEGYSYEEVAQMTNSSLGSVKSRLNRARTLLQTMLAEVRDEY